MSVLYILKRHLVEFQKRWSRRLGRNVYQKYSNCMSGDKPLSGGRNESYCGIKVI